MRLIPAGPPDKFTEETIDGNGFGTLNNYDDVLDACDAYMKPGTPSDEQETVDLIQIVVVDGEGFSVDLDLFTALNFDPATGESDICTRDLSFDLPTLTAGDADGDGDVDLDDLVILVDSWDQGGSNYHWADGDFTLDGVVDYDDFDLLVDNWSGQGSAVPEPSMAGLLLLLSCSLWIWRLRR